METNSKRPRNWRKKVEGKLVADQFDLHTRSAGEEGWNPETPRKEIPGLFKLAAEEDHETFGCLLHFLCARDGGHNTNRDNEKAQRNFALTAAKWREDLEAGINPLAAGEDKTAAAGDQTEEEEEDSDYGSVQADVDEAKEAAADDKGEREAPTEAMPLKSTQTNANAAAATPKRAPAAAAASAAARRKKRDKTEGLAADGLVAAAAKKPRKRGFFLVTKSLTLDIADEICNLAIETATKNGFNPICICVMDPAGHVIVTKRMDGCPPMVYPKISHAKANTCVSTNTSSRAYGAKYLQRSPSNDNDNDDDDGNHGGEVGPSTFTRVINQISIAGGDMAAFQGGILVKEKSTGGIVASVGVSGAAGDEDEFCALEGVHKCSMARELTTVPEQHCSTTNIYWSF